jgi:radical SAM protein with 4Fe4S-binding SPASM domain
MLKTLTMINEAGIDSAVITNGQLLCGDIAEALRPAKWIRISMDSCNKEDYAKIRNISLDSFDKVCANILNFSKIKNEKCELGINFVVNHENYNQIYEMIKLVKNLGANHIKLSPRVTKDLLKYHESFKDDAISQIHKAIGDFEDEKFRIINIYEEDFSVEMSYEREYTRCPIKEIYTVIAADSKVYFCHDKAYVSGGVVGDIKNKSFKEMWFSEETRKLFNSFNPSKECKHHCAYDSRVKLLNAYLDLDKTHINFI